MEKTVHFPEDMREFVTTKRHVIMVSLPTIVHIFFLFFVFLCCIFFVTSIRQHGIELLVYPSYWLMPLLEYVAILVPVFALACLLIFRAAGRQKVIDIPVWYGFDAQSIYITNRYGSSTYLWEYFSAVQEKNDFFLFNDGARKIMWPKSVWSEEELARQRALINENVAPKGQRKACPKP